MLLQQVLLLPHHTSKAKLEISLRHWDVHFCGICATPEGKLVVFIVARRTLCSSALLCASRCFLWNAWFLSDAPHHSAPSMSFPANFLTGSTGLKIFLSQTSVSQHLIPKAKTISVDYLSYPEHSSSTGCFSRFSTGKPTRSSKQMLFIALKNWPSLSAKISEG